MKRLVVLAIALALAACDQESSSPAGPSTTGPLIFAAQLLASNENPPISGAESSGRGTVTITITVPRDTAGTPAGPGTVTFSMQAGSLAAGSPIILGHIHVGAASVNGPIVVNTDLTPTGANGAGRRDGQSGSHEPGNLAGAGHGHHGQPVGLLLQPTLPIESRRGDERAIDTSAVSAPLSGPDDALSTGLADPTPT